MCRKLLSSDRNGGRDTDWTIYVGADDGKLNRSTRVLDQNVLGSIGGP